MSSLLDVYKKLDVEVEKADGKYIWDTEGKRYTDFLSGISVTNLGHLNGKVKDRVSGAMESYMHVSNLYREPMQEELAEKLSERTFGGKVFFSNSGTEANETAVKVARKYFEGEKYEVITLKDSFHGRSLAMLSATGQGKFREGFGPGIEGFQHCDFNFLASVEEKISRKTCAVMVEVIQGEGGVNVGDEDFITGLRNICDEKGILLIVDEIQTGIGRTGTFWGYEHYGICPDIITSAKALGGGLPLGATVLNREVAECMKHGDHGSTFGGNPLSCAASLAVLSQIDEAMLERVKETGEYLKKSLLSISRYYDKVKEVRGRGLMVAIELENGGNSLLSFLIEKGFIVGCSKGRVIRFLPPFIIEKKDIDEITEVIGGYFKERE